MEKQFLRISEVAGRLGVHPHTIKKYADSGKIPCFRDPANYRRFKVSDVERFKREFLTREK